MIEYYKDEFCRGILFYFINCREKIINLNLKGVIYLGFGLGILLVEMRGTRGFYEVVEKLLE